MKNFSLRQFILSVTIICCLMGMFKLGYDQGYTLGRHSGFKEAKVHFDITLQANAKNNVLWKHLQDVINNGKIDIAPGPIEDKEAYEFYYKQLDLSRRWPIEEYSAKN